MKRGSKLAKVAIAKQKASIVDINADIEDDRSKFSTVLQDYGVTYDSSGSIKTNDVLDKLNVLIELFGITFNRVDNRLVLDSENYTTHSHDYNDATINDTNDGTGTKTEEIKTSSGVN